MRFAGALAIWALTGCSNDHAWGSTVGAQCSEVMTALCGRANDACDAGITDCVASNVPLCCEGLCKSAGIASEDDIQRCTGDIASAPCDVILSSVPATCAGVVKLPR